MPKPTNLEIVLVRKLGGRVTLTDREFHDVVPGSFTIHRHEEPNGDVTLEVRDKRDARNRVIDRVPVSVTTHARGVPPPEPSRGRDIEERSGLIECVDCGGLVNPTSPCRFCGAEDPCVGNYGGL